MEQDEKWQTGRKYLDLALYYRKQNETAKQEAA